MQDLNVDQKIEETRSYLLEEIKHNDFVSRKHKKTCKTLSYIEHVLILATAFTGCVSISAFASVVGIPVGITSSAIGLKSCVITARIKKYNLIIEKKKKKHDQIVFLAKTNVNSAEVLISRVLTDSYISHDEFVLVNDLLKEYDKMKEEIKIVKS